MIADKNHSSDELELSPSIELPRVEEEPVAKKRPNRAVMGVVVGALVLAAGYKGWTSYTFNLAHVSTDNAYVTGDLVNISPSVSGTLKELKVEDGDFVHKGQLIARLDSDSAAAELSQAEANLRAAESEIPQAQATLAYTQMSTAAAIHNSQAAISTQRARTAGSRIQVKLSSDTVKSQVAQAESQLEQARAQYLQAEAGVASANDGLVNARQAVQTAQNNAGAANAAVSAARAEADRAAKDLQRYQTLFADEAISRQQYDGAVAASASASANLEAAQQKASAADSEIAQARTAVSQAQEQISAAKSQAQASAKQIQVAQAGLGLARANLSQVGIQSANVQTNESQGTQASAELQAAQAGTEQVSLRQTQIGTAQAQLQQAKAAVAHAQVQVQDSFLYAPCDGYVVKHSANVGTSINPGQTIVTITRGNQIWVMGNFKETQLENVREGQPAELEVDTFPGHTFHGRVLSVIHATGSATTLLPPDNSTGNFTKIVQRIPVKISIDSDGDKTTNLLRQGMSVVATIDTGSQRK